ncbi:cyclophilin-like fold protein [Zhouia amylolytica]|uniref:cyclophilin-like fold protein n=1 Tax=Zhouia amylolytica TaxID=376730 RepID=UPI0020CDC2B2|nr:cyclophilin-like fold protein [Zhouia amylolytica]MCQ0112251.1 hypothetical protein [Zhouia amylolytica]
MKKIILPLIILVSLSLSSFDNITESKIPETVQTKENSSDIVISGKIKITIDGKVYIFKLMDSKAGEELLKMLPFESSANVYHNNHYYIETPKGLSVKGLKPTRDPKKGYLVYSAEYRGLGIFFADGHFDKNEMFYIGELEGGFSDFDAKKIVQIKIEL